MMKRLSGGLQFVAKCQETTRHYATLDSVMRYYTYHLLSDWSELAFSLIQL